MIFSMGFHGRKFGLLWGALALLGCGRESGGKEAASPSDAGVQPADGVATADGVGTGERDATDDSRTSGSLFQMIDDMDHATAGYPQLPPGSSAFFWSAPSSVGIGNWFVSFETGSGRDAHVDVIEPARGTSKKACHLSGSNLARGADLWAQLDHPFGAPVDLGAYAGISFWARLDSISSKLVVAMNNRPGSEFYAASAGASPLPAVTMTVGSEWQHFVIPFEDLGINPTSVVSVDFVAGAGGEPFDVWIDDLALLCRGVCK